MKNILMKTCCFLFVITILFFSSCKKDKEETPSANSRMVKYEITGNFSGKLFVVYLDNISGNTLVNDVTLPWSKEVTYGNNVIGIGISGQSSAFGVAGQTATLKIYSGGTVVKSETVIASNVGGIILPSFTYTF
jgi:Mycobacterium membrane protein